MNGIICGICGDKGYTNEDGTYRGDAKDGCIYGIYNAEDMVSVGHEDHGLIKRGERCPECNAMYGNYHHHWCRYDECPDCQEPSNTCGCNYWADSFDTPEEYEAWKAEHGLQRG